MRILVGAIAIALLAAACGDGETTTTGAAPLTPIDVYQSAGADNEAATPDDANDADGSAGDDQADPPRTDPADSAAGDGGTGDGGSTVVPAGQVDPEAAAAAAATNIDTLRADDDVRLTQLLNVADGTAASIRDAVDGDRPVLLWFWAPH